MKDLEESEVPLRARQYYELPKDAKFRDLILAVRADEAIHREMNHYFCDLGPNEIADHHENISVNEKKDDEKSEESRGRVHR